MDAAVEFPEPDIGDSGMQLSLLDKYVAQRGILGADMSEVVNPDQLKRIAAALGDLCSVDVMEVYSPERVAAMCKNYGLVQGASLDLTNGYDFDKQEDRQREGHRDE